MSATDNLSLQEASAQREKNRLQRFRRRFHWLLSPWLGYPACVLLVAIILLIEKIDEYFPHPPIFIGTPFALATVLSALIWGWGPALVTIVLGFISLAYFIPNDIFTPDILKDLHVNAPFIIAQLIAAAVVIRLERYHRKLEDTYQALNTAHQELKVTQQQLLQNNRQLERANDLKDYIITRASHELRTPLTTILGRTQLLAARLKKSGETPENWTALQRYMEVVEARALHLRTLIDSLFDLSRIRSREIPLHKHSFDLGELCRNIIAEQRHLSGRVIAFELPPHALVVQANQELLSQVLVNLISNAIKYSPEGSPIQVTLSSDESEVTLRVHNECPALSPEQLDHLFEPFYRTPEVEYSSIPGWGLGLTICKEIVEQYKGHIWAEATEREGITFFIKLPRLVKAEQSTP